MPELQTANEDKPQRPSQIIEAMRVLRENLQDSHAWSGEPDRVMHVLLVDKDDNEIGAAWFDDLTVDSYHRTVGLWLENSSGEVLVAQRGHNMRTSPGKWSFSAAGRLEPGETYVSNILKEAEEEIGIKDIKVELVTKFFVASNTRPHFCSVFRAEQDVAIESLTLHPDEVAAVRWISKADLRVWMEREREVFTHSFLRFTKEFLENT